MATPKPAGTSAPLVLAALLGIGAWAVYAAVRQTEQYADLIAAIKRGDDREIEVLLENGAGANAREYSDTRTVWQQMRDMFLRRGPKGRSTPALAVALRRYAYPDAPYWFGRSIRTAREAQQRDLIMHAEGLQTALLKHGADPNVEDVFGFGPLTWACAYDDKPLLQLALARGAQVNAQGKFSITSLMFAAANNEVETVETLLARGADVNIKNPRGTPALLYALRPAHCCPPLMEVVKLLVEHGADVNVRNATADTPLRAAADAKRPDLLSLLRRAGAKE
jgi:ankyrin repeat protein